MQTIGWIHVMAVRDIFLSTLVAKELEDCLTEGEILKWINTRRFSSSSQKRVTLAIVKCRLIVKDGTCDGGVAMARQKEHYTSRNKDAI